MRERDCVSLSESVSMRERVCVRVKAFECWQAQLVADVTLVYVQRQACPAPYTLHPTHCTLHQRGTCRPLSAAPALRFRVWCLGSGVCNLGVGFGVWGGGLRVLGSEFRIKVWRLGFGVGILGFGVWG